MTASQTKAIEKIKQWIGKNDMLNNTEIYEYKELEIKETDYGTVIFFSVVGMKGDEGTMAEVICRNRRQIFIGRHGGLKAMVYDKKKKRCKDVNGFLNVMIDGYEH